MHFFLLAVFPPWSLAQGLAAPVVARTRHRIRGMSLEDSLHQYESHLHAKSVECAKLAEQRATLQQRLRGSEAELLAAVAKQRELEAEGAALRADEAVEQVRSSYVAHSPSRDGKKKLACSLAAVTG